MSDDSGPAQPVVVTRAAALMADWACYMDEPHYHDPEVAFADGYGDVPLPPGALTILAFAPEVFEFARTGPLRRSWRARRPVVIDEELQLTVVAGERMLIGKFLTGAGEEVVREEIAVGADEASVSRGVPVVQTGTIDETRRRALVSCVSQLRPGGGWPWGQAPSPAVGLCWRLVAPALLAGRAAVRGPDAARRIRGVDVVECGPHLPANQSLVAESAGRSGAGTVWSILAGDDIVAQVTVEVDDGPRTEAGREV